MRPSGRSGPSFYLLGLFVQNVGLFAETLEDRFLTALPQSHSSALSHLESVVLHGIPTYVMSGFTGKDVREAIQSFSPTIVAGFPQTYASLVLTGIEIGEFESVRKWLSMGDAMHGAHIKEILKAAPKSEFVDSFGSSELGMALFRSISTIDNVSPSRCVGRPVEFASCKVFDLETGEECDEEEVGYLTVRSPTITPGYWGKKDQTKAAWYNGYFITGDIGIVKNGSYYLIDRAVDQIQIDNEYYYTLIAEELLQDINGVVDAVVVGCTDKATPTVMALILTKEKVNDSDGLMHRVVTCLRSYLNAREGLEVIVMLTNNPAAIPIGSTGKTLKRKMRNEAINISNGLIGESSSYVSHMLIDTRNIVEQKL